MDQPKPKDVEAYIARCNEEARAIMEELRKIIKSTIPEVVEVISWNVPIYRYHGILAGFSVAKHHVSFGADALNDKDREILGKEGHKTGKKTLQIRFGQKVPTTVIRKILRTQAKMNEMKSNIK